MVSLQFAVNRSCQEQSSLSLNLWGLGQVTASDSDQGRVQWKLLCRINSATIVQALGTVELARACATEVDPAPLLPVVQARTAFGGERQAFQVLRITFRVCICIFSFLHRPHLLLESLALCPQTSRATDSPGDPESRLWQADHCSFPALKGVVVVEGSPTAFNHHCWPQAQAFTASSSQHFTPIPRPRHFIRTFRQNTVAFDLTRHPFEAATGSCERSRTRLHGPATPCRNKSNLSLVESRQE